MDEMLTIWPIGYSISNGMLSGGEKWNIHVSDTSMATTTIRGSRYRLTDS